MHTIAHPGSVRRYGPVFVWLLCAGLGLVSTNSRAVDDDPASRVARISYLKGPVYVQTADDKSWSDAGINRPLTRGDQLWTDSQGRSELQMGSTTIQVDANTQLRLSELNDDELQLVVTQGVVNVRVRNLDNDKVEIDTPNAAVTPVEPGTYRIEVAETDEVTIVQVRAGQAQVAGEKQEFTLRDDEQLSLRGTQRLTAEFDELARMDEFDRWAQDRNDRAERVASSRYVAADVIGYEDLDDYGYWSWYNDYGYVWMPTRINAGWAPYRYGHWTWVSPWGWTWIDDAPWGFAPFHYGRWAMLDRRWCWVPGPRAVRAVYAPALVAWVGTPGLNVSISVGHQPIGWIPLGPREVYRPYYRGSHAYITRVNLSNSLLNNSDFERGYRRQPHDDEFRNRGAASVVQADTLRHARPVNNHLIRTERERLQPLNAQSLTRSEMPRPERDEAAQNSRQVSPPVTPNTRDVLTRRQFRTPDETNHVVPHNRSRDRYDSQPSANSDQNPRFIGTPSTRRDVTEPRQYDRSTNRPAAPANHTPHDAAPPTRQPSWAREEVQPGRRETSGLPHDRQTAPMNRERTMTIPANPAPMRGAPVPTPPARTSEQPSPDTARSQRGWDNNGHRGRGDR